MTKQNGCEIIIRYVCTKHSNAPECSYFKSRGGYGCEDLCEHDRDRNSVIPYCKNPKARDEAFEKHIKEQTRKCF